MSKCCLITTYYCDGCKEPSKIDVINKFNYDGNINDIYVNFSNKFSPWNFSEIPYVGNTKRKDLVYGKIFMLKSFIINNILNKYDYICHIDYNDTRFTGSFIEMINKFINSKKNIIISTEKNCWPYIEVVGDWIGESLKNIEFNYINSGAVIGKTSKFIEILTSLETLCKNSMIDFWDDQGVWQYYVLNIEALEKDVKCEYFFSTALLDESYYSIINGEIFTKFKTKPYLIHDNSSYSLNLINKININL